MKKNRSHAFSALLSFVFLILAVVLEALPYGVTMRFAKGPNDFYIVKQSYFSLLPMGYGDVLPLLIGVLSAAACLALGVCRLTRGKGKKLAFVLGSGAAILGILRLFLLQGYENGIMWTVTVLLILSWAVQFREKCSTKGKNDTE